MDKIQVLILDSDIHYSHALSMYIVNSHHKYTVKVFNDYYQMDKYSKECENSEKKIGDILLIDQDYKRKYNYTYCLCITMIKDKEDLIRSEGFNKIYKYYSADKIVNEVIYKYEKMFNKKAEAPEKQSKLIGFFSAAGGTGTTTISVSVSRILSTYHKKVLYLSFEDIPSIFVYFQETINRKTISDFLYQFFIKEKENVIRLIHDYLITDKWGVDTFVSSINYYNLIQLCKEDVQVFLKYLCENTNYDYICLDISNPFQVQNSMALSMCNRLYNILNQNETSLYKFKRLNEYAKKTQELKCLSDASLVINRYKQFSFEKNYIIYEYIDSYNNELLLEGSLGEDVKKIVKDIIFN